jgi:hypothetical protein
VWSAREKHVRTGGGRWLTAAVIPQERRGEREGKGGFG